MAFPLDTLIDLFRSVHSDGGDDESLRVDATITGTVPLPTGAATAAKQDTGNTSLASIDSKLGGASTAAINTSITVGTSSTQVLAANSARKLAYIVNNNGVKIFIKLGATAVANEGISLSANGGIYEIGANNLWLGSVNAIKATGAGVPVEVFEATT